jgi:hypothetical protein
MKINLKNSVVIFSFLAIGIFMIPNFASATITFTPPSPLLYSSSTIASCSTGVYLVKFKPILGVPVLVGCSSARVESTPGQFGEYRYIECTAGCLSSCYSWATCSANPGFISSTTINFLEKWVYILPVSNTIPADLLAYAGRLFTDLKSILILLIGIPVGFFIIKRSISLISKRTKTRF